MSQTYLGKARLHIPERLELSQTGYNPCHRVPGRDWCKSFFASGNQYHKFENKVQTLTTSSNHHQLYNNIDINGKLKVLR